LKISIIIEINNNEKPKISIENLEENQKGIEKVLKSNKKPRPYKCKYCGNMFAGSGFKKHESACKERKKEVLKALYKDVNIPQNKEKPLVTVFNGKVDKKVEIDNANSIRMH
jgi:predicted Zn-ribbon and HTH transcriptional regulator